MTHIVSPEIHPGITYAWWVTKAAKDIKTDKFCVTAGYGCLRGSTKIHTSRGLVPIAEITHKDKVLSYDEKNNQLVLAPTSGAFLKGKDYLREVSTKQGKFASTYNHQIFSSGIGYLPVGRLNVSDEISVVSPSLLKTIQESIQLKFPLNAPDCSEIYEDLLFRYSELAHRCGQRLVEAQDNDQDVFLQLVDVHEFCRVFFSALHKLMDAQQAQKYKHNHLLILFDHLEKSRFRDLLCILSYDELAHTLTLPLEHIWVFLEVISQFLDLNETHRNIQLRAFDVNSSCDLPVLAYSNFYPCDAPKLERATIAGYGACGNREEFYDMTVPLFHNYICENGVIHHNSGKSHGSWQWLFEMMRLSPDCKTFFYAEPTYDLIEKIALESFRKVAFLNGWIENLHFRVVTSKNARIEFLKTKQKILLLSMDKPASLVGFEAGAGVIDEAALCKKDAIDRLEQRLRATGTTRKQQLLLVTTPEGLNHVADEYDSEVQSGWVFLNEFDAIKVSTQHTAIGEQYTYKRRFRLTTYGNQLNLPPNYIAKIYDKWGHNQNFIDSYIFGHFRPFSTGLAYSAYKAPLHKIAPIEASPFVPIQFTWDFNICPQWEVLQVQKAYDQDDTGTRILSTFDAVIANGNHGHEQLEDAVCQEFVEKFPRYKFAQTPIHIYGDPTGHHKNWKAKFNDFKNIKHWLNALRYTNVTIHAAKSMPLERVSVNMVNRRFSENTLKVCDDCDMVLMSLSRTCWARGEQQRLDKPQNDTWTHPMDGIKCWEVAKNQRPKIL